MRGVELRLHHAVDLDDPEFRRMPAALSPDKTRLLVYLSQPNAKTVWVVNLDRREVEFENRDNRGRHMAGEWLDEERFQLTFSGPSYETAYTFRRTGGQWGMVSQQDLRPAGTPGPSATNRISTAASRSR